MLAFIIAAILSAIAYAFIFWNPGDRWIEESPEIIPRPIVALQ